MKRKSVDRPSHALVTAALLAAALTCACSSAPPKRSVLVADTVDEPPPSLLERVEEIRESQTEALAHFQRAHEVFEELTRPQATDLGGLLRDLRREAKDCERDADRLADQIAGLKAQSEELTAAWEARLDQLPDDDARKKGKRSLKETREGTEKVVAALRVVQKNMAPVLVSLQDYVLFFDHNLNARAIAALDDTYATFGEDVAALMQEMERTRDEIVSFLTTVGPDPVQPDPAPADPIQPDPVQPDPDPVVPAPTPTPDPVAPPDPAPDPAPPTGGPDPATGDPADPNAPPDPAQQPR